MTGGKTWDERRNRSLRRDAPPGSAKALLEHLAANREQEWYRWPIAFAEAQREGHEPPSVYRCKCGRHVMEGFGCSCGRARS